MSAKTCHDITSMDAVNSPQQHDHLPAVCDDDEHELQHSYGASQNYPAQAANSSFDEEMLNSAFLVCDSEGKGKVSVIQIIDYLKSVTDANRDGNRLQVLCKMFDPDDQGILVDQQTFRTVMTQWITSCCQDRDLGTPLDDVFIKDLEQQPDENKCYNTGQLDRYSGHVTNYTREQADLISIVADLTLTNKKLSDQKIRLQKNLEFAEETNASLTEEIAEIKCKLKSSQQAIQQTQSIRSELEDMKTFTKGLEDKSSVLHTQNKKLEKETLMLSSQIQLLHEENDKLLIEKEKAKEKLDKICSENSKLVLQLCEYERLLLQKENILAQKTLQSEKLHAQIEEYKCLLENRGSLSDDQRNVFNKHETEKKGFQDQFSQTNEDMDINTHLSQNQCSSNQPKQSVCKELQEVLELGLPDPLCGILEDTSLLKINMVPEDICAEIKLMLDHLKKMAHGLHSNLQDKTSFSISVSQLKAQTSIFVQSLRCLMQMKCAWETYAIKLNGAPQINTQEELSTSERTRLEHSVLKGNMQLVPYHKPNKSHQKDTLIEGFSSRSPSSTYRFLLRAPRGSSLLTPGILLLFFLFGFLLLPIKSSEHMWTVAAGLLWPHLRMQYLDMPPF